MRLTETFAMHPVWNGGLNLALTDLLREIKQLGDSLTLVRERLGESSGQRDEGGAHRLLRAKCAASCVDSEGGG